MKISAAQIRAQLRAKEEKVQNSNVFTEATEVETKEEPKVEVTAVGTVEKGEAKITQVGDLADRVEEVVQERKQAEETAATVVEEETKTPEVTAETEAPTPEPQVEPIVEPQEPEEEVGEEVIPAEASLTDTAVFQQLTKTTEASGVDGSDSYAELVENMVSTQCQMSGVKNLDLTTFGLRAQVLSFPNLSVIEYGVHKFLGAPFTEQEENVIIHRLGLYVAQSEKDKVVIRAVQEVKDSRGMSFYSLMFSEKIAQRFADTFNYTVKANLKESDVSKLVLIVQK